MAGVSAHGMQRTRFREDGQKQGASPGQSSLTWNRVTAQSLGRMWQSTVSNPDGPNQLTVTRQDSRHLALKPTQV